MFNLKILETKFTSQNRRDPLGKVAFLKDRHGKNYSERYVKPPLESPVKIERKKSGELFIVDLSQPVNSGN